MWKKTDVYHYVRGNRSVCGLTIFEGETLDTVQFMRKILYNKEELCSHCTNLQNWKQYET